MMEGLRFILCRHPGVTPWTFIILNMTCNKRRHGTKTPTTDNCFSFVAPNPILCKWWTPYLIGLLFPGTRTITTRALLAGSHSSRCRELFWSIITFITLLLKRMNTYIRLHVLSLSLVVAELTSPGPSPSPKPKSKPWIPKSQIQRGEGEFGFWAVSKIWWVGVPYTVHGTWFR